jgi:1-acyl-sn-glycerol-3-phosphate acyltransferase
MLIFCRHVVFDKPQNLRRKGPLLLAFNHPNSFLDAIIIDIFFDEPVWSLARGDAFKGNLVKKILYGVKIMPVYRTSEGVENLSENYKTFNDCIAIFKNNGLVQIFSEGKCVNEWHLRPLKKGTARLAIQAWEQNIPLEVLPLGINYSSFERFGKNVFIHFGEPITVKDIDLSASDGIRNQTFNTKLQKQLEQLVYEIPSDDKETQEKRLTRRPGLFEKILLFTPALIGFLVNAPLYIPVKNFVKKKAGGTGHYDSVMLGVLLITYPFYLLIMVLIAYLIFNTAWVWLILFLFPFTAWSFVRLKEQLDR